MNRGENGYTLIEMMVIVSILSMLTTILIVYNRTGERQIIVFKEQAKIINTILRAKSLAISTYAEGDTPCAYGIHFGKDLTGEWEYRIFKDLDSSGSNDNCGTADNKYDPDSEHAVEENFFAEKLDKALEFSELEFTNEFIDIVFIPPEPIVKITPPPAENEVTLTIKTPHGKVSKTIKVNSFGQITAE